MFFKLLKYSLIAAGIACGNFISLAAKKPAENSWYKNISIPDRRVLVFYPSDKIEQSRVFTLESREEFEYCQTGKKGLTCRQLSPGEMIKRKIRFQVYPAADIFPWEYNKFEISLKGRYLSARLLEGSHEWSITKVIAGDTVLFHARAVRKIKMDPDRNGINFETAKYKSGILNLFFSDKWSRHYKGKTEIRFALFKNRFFVLRDEKVGEWIFERSPEKIYKLRLSEERIAEMKNGKYYLKWSFRRSGDNISNPVWIEKSRTPDFRVKN